MQREFNRNLLTPLPVTLIGALVDGRPNYLVIGYITPFNFGKHIFFSLYKQRHTRLGIHQTGTFSVNIPAKNLLEQTLLCGTKSGRDIDKSALFDPYYGELKTAPMIRECPVSMECEVSEVLDYDHNEGIIGRVVKSYVDSDCLTGDQLDLRRLEPMVWGSGGDHGFYLLGERLDQTTLAG